MANLNKLSRSQLRDMLDGMGIQTSVDSDGDLYTVLGADTDFSHNVIVYFVIDGDWLGVTGFADGFDIEDRNLAAAIFYANEFNRRAKLPKVFISNNRYRLEHWTLIDEEVSEAFVRENCIRMIVPMIWRFFAETERQFTRGEEGRS